MTHANEHFCTVGAAAYSYAVDRLGDALVLKCETDELDGHAVAACGDSSFSKLLHVASIACPAGVRSIGQRAFEQCRSLVRLALPAVLDKLAGDVRSITSTARLLHLKRDCFAGHAHDYEL